MATVDSEGFKAEAYSESCKTSKMERAFCKNIKKLKVVNYFRKKFHSRRLRGFLSRVCVIMCN